MRLNLILLRRNCTCVPSPQSTKTRRPLQSTTWAEGFTADPGVAAPHPKTVTDKDMGVKVGHTGYPNKIVSLILEMTQKRLFGPEELRVLLHRLACQLRESHRFFEHTVLIGLQPRGVALAQALAHLLRTEYGIADVATGSLDATFFRDDFRRRDEPLRANRTEIAHSIEGKKVVLIDDVLYTGRTLRAALDALHAFGRPQRTELLVLIDRRFRRELPIQPDYVGRHVDALDTEKVRLDWSPQGELESVSLIQEKSAQ
jgi:pyrimidine operon attenuation protein/uracil phosphoribosyltransferase